LLGECNHNILVLLVWILSCVMLGVGIAIGWSIWGRK
jgi:hypothetical protein